MLIWLADDRRIVTSRICLDGGYQFSMLDGGYLLALNLLVVGGNISKSNDSQND